MSEPIPINFAVEDDLSEAILKAINKQLNNPFVVGRCFKRSGFGYLKKSILGFNNAAKGTPFLVLTDLDKTECPPKLIKDWFRDTPKHSNLIFRIAVKEVETWILAHRKAFACFLGIQKTFILEDVENINDPKNFLISLAKRSRYRIIRESIVPPPKSTREHGPDYNGRLTFFVNDFWDANIAAENSQSLKKAIEAITQFKPTWDALTK